MCSFLYDAACEFALASKVLNRLRFFFSFITRNVSFSEAALVLCIMVLIWQLNNQHPIRSKYTKQLRTITKVITHSIVLSFLCLRIQPSFIFSYRAAVFARLYSGDGQWHDSPEGSTVLIADGAGKGERAEYN